MQCLIKSQVVALILLLTVHTAFGAEVVSKSRWDDTAIGGHDTVAYHTPTARTTHLQVKGEDRFAVHWNGARWQFASQASANKFAADPQRYRPQYNGHCANALSLGEGLIATDGTVWEFFGENLHLFYAERGRQRWLNGDWKQYKADADQAWEDLKIPEYNR